MIQALEGSRGTDAQVRDAASRGHPVALAQVLVAIPSVNPGLESGGAGEGRVAEQCARWLAEWGFEVDLSEPASGRPNVLARHRGTDAGPTLLLNGHTDTVGVAGMTVPPFEGLVEGGRLVGRGACDMKAGVASLLSAAASLAEAGHPGELLVALTMDEEHASLGMQAMVARGVRADAAVVCEPTGLMVMPAHKGFVWADLEVRGRAAHGSRPDVGIDAIRHAGRFLVELDALESELRSRPAHPLLGHASLHAGTIAGGVAPSVYPERCRLVLERRTLPGETVAEVRRELEATLARTRGAVRRFDARLTLGLARPGTEVAHDHPLVVGLLDAARTCGRETGVEGMTAWVDAAFLNEAGTPAVCFGPGSIEQAHSTDEWIELGQIPACAEILETFARRFLEGR